MGATSSRESELSARIIDAIECGHAHTLMLLLKFCVHAPEGGPAAQLARKAAAANAAAPVTASQSQAIANFKPRRPVPAADATASELDPATAAFHARAVALARSQAQAAGSGASASFPLPLDLNSLRLRSGDALVIGLAKRGDAPENEVAMLRLLAAAGVDLDVQDGQGWTSLHHASALGHTRCLQVLLDAGALALVHANSSLLASQCTADRSAIRLLQDRERLQDSLVVQEVVAAAGGSYVGRSLVFEESSSSGFPLLLYRMRMRCAASGSASILVAPRAEVAEIEIFFRSPAQRSPGDCVCLYYVDNPSEKPWALRPRIGSVWYLSSRRKRMGVVPPPMMMEGEMEASSAPATAATASSSSSSPASAPAGPLSPSEIVSLGWDSLSITLKLDSIALGSSWRFVYFDSIRQAPLAATDVFTIRAAPAAPAAAGGARRASSAGSAASSSSGGGGGGSIFSFLPSLWGSSGGGGATSPSSASASSAGGAAPPVALHPSFARLSDPSPSNLAAFLSPPPPFFRSHFALNTAAATLALQLDPRLSGFKERFVAPPHAAAATPSGNAKSGMLRESEFWVRYFYLMSQLPAEPLSARENERYQPQRALVHGQSQQQQQSQLSVYTASSPAASPASASSSSAAAPAPAAASAAVPVSSPVSSCASTHAVYASPHTANASGSDATVAVASASEPTVVQAVALSPAAAAAAAAAAFTAPPVSGVVVDAPAPVRSAVAAPPAASVAPLPVLRPGPIAAAVAVADHSARGSVSAASAATPSDDEDEANSGYVPPSFAALPLTAASSPTA